MILYRFFFAIGMLFRSIADFFYQHEEAFLAGYMSEIDVVLDGEEGFDEEQDEEQ